MPLIPGRPVRPEGGDRLVLALLEHRPHAGGELRLGHLDLSPAHHGHSMPADHDNSGRRPRAATRRPGAAHAAPHTPPPRHTPPPTPHTSSNSCVRPDPVCEHHDLCASPAGGAASALVQSTRVGPVDRPAHHLRFRRHSYLYVCNNCKRSRETEADHGRTNASRVAGTGSWARPWPGTGWLAAGRPAVGGGPPPRGCAGGCRTAGTHRRTPDVHGGPGGDPGDRRAAAPGRGVHRRRTPGGPTGPPQWPAGSPGSES